MNAECFQGVPLPLSKARPGSGFHPYYAGCRVTASETRAIGIQLLGTAVPVDMSLLSTHRRQVLECLEQRHVFEQIYTATHKMHA